MSVSKTYSEPERVAVIAQAEKGGMGGASTALQRIDFQGDAVWAGEVDGDVMVAVKPICERFGVAWHGQLERIKRDEVLADGIRVIPIPSDGGMQDTCCLPLALLPGFLFGISARRIADPEVRARVIAYKRECHDVLFRHFFRSGRSRRDRDRELTLLEKTRVLREIRLSGGPGAAGRWMAQLGLGEPDGPRRCGGAPVRPVAAFASVESGWVRDFLEQHTRQRLGARVQAAIFLAAFNACQARLDRPSMNARRFGDHMRDIGIAKLISQRYYYLDRELIESPPAPLP